jgi:hypothetical protein
MKLAFWFISRRPIRAHNQTEAKAKLKKGEALVSQYTHEFGWVYSAESSVRYTCASSLELFDALARYKRIRTLYSIMMPQRWTSRRRGYTMATTKRNDFVVNGRPVSIDASRLQDRTEASAEYIEMLTQEVWDLGVELQAKGMVQSFEEAYPNGARRPGEKV